MTGQDEKIKKDVLDELYDDSRVDASTITVSVEGGDVVLGGSVSTHDAAAAALERALGVAGIASVLNQMEVQLPGTGPVVEPEALRARVQALIDADQDLAGADIQVRVRKGVVVLEGTVDALWKKLQAEKRVLRQPGIAGIRNHLAAVPTESVDDARIAGDILDVLRQEEGIHEDDINVQVAEGVVHLTGTVQERRARRRIAMAAAHTPGVVQVIDNLVIVKKTI